MARPRKPHALKIAEGYYQHNPQRRKHVEPSPDVKSPPCPAHLKGIARNEWRRICHELAGLGVISLAERGSIEQYCQAYGEWRECLKIVQKEGRFIETDFGPKEHPAAKTARALADQCIKLLSSFGMTPTSRTRLEVKEAKPNEDIESKYLA